MDYLIFEKIYSLSGKSIFLDTLNIFISRYFIWLMLFLFFLNFFRKDQRSISLSIFLKLLASIVLTLLINHFISLIWLRERPFVTHPEITPLLTPTTKKSFPSNHAAIAFAITFFDLIFLRKFWGVFLVMAVLVALSRIFVGVHYPTDIIAGAISGFLAVLIVKKFPLDKRERFDKI